MFVGKSTQGRYLNGLIGEIRRRYDQVTWGSFNWDYIFEASFWYSTGPDTASRINPTVVIPLANWRNHSTKNLFLKLHGGINWWMVRGVLTYMNFSSELPRQWEEYEARDTDVGDFPVILEPSYYKYSDSLYELLKPQWDVLQTNLSTADLILIVGYSLPDADSNARSVLTHAFQKNEAARWAVIDPSPQVCAKYRRSIDVCLVECGSTQACRSALCTTAARRHWGEGLRDEAASPAETRLHLLEHVDVLLKPVHVLLHIRDGLAEFHR